MFFLKKWLSVGAVVLLSACAAGPNYHTPDITRSTADTLRAPQDFVRPHAGQSTELANWWRDFDDPLVARLIDATEQDNLSLAQAAARIKAARAERGVALTAFLPGGGTQLAVTESRANGASSKTTAAVLDASWELDIFGGLRRGAEGANARLASSVDSWHDLRVSLAAETANVYVGLRACEAQRDLLRSDVASREKSVKLTNLLVEEGFMAPAEAALVEAGTASTRQQFVSAQVSCTSLGKSLSMLTGIDEVNLTRELLDGQRKSLPAPRQFVVDSVPLVVVSQRPDVAAAERNLAAANADIGVARANRLPRLSLSGNISLGFLGVKLGDANDSNTSSSFGPVLSLPILNAARLANLERAARARYEESQAAYQQKVEQAVNEIEMALVNLDGANQRVKSAHTAADKFAYYFNASEVRYEVGTGSLLDLEDARRSQFMAKQSLIDTERDRVLYWISLYKAAGGDWRERVISNNQDAGKSHELN